MKYLKIYMHRNVAYLLLQELTNLSFCIYHSYRNEERLAYIFMCAYTQEYVIVFESTNTSNVIVSSSSLTVKDREEENLIFASSRPIDPSL